MSEQNSRSLLLKMCRLPWSTLRRSARGTQLLRVRCVLCVQRNGFACDLVSSFDRCSRLWECLTLFFSPRLREWERERMRLREQPTTPSDRRHLHLPALHACEFACMHAPSRVCELESAHVHSNRINGVSMAAITWTRKHAHTQQSTKRRMKGWPGCKSNLMPIAMVLLTQACTTL